MDLGGLLDTVELSGDCSRKGYALEVNGSQRGRPSTN